MNKNQKEDLLQFPAIINVNVFRGACICNCIHCPVGITPVESRKEKFHYSHMNLQFFQKIVDEVSIENKNTVLRIHSVGEPILWNYLAPGIEYAKSKSIHTWLFTSCVTNNYSLLETICDNLSIIEVSINSTDSEEYRKTKGVDKFQEVKRNIEYMNSYIKNKMFSTRLIVSRVQSIDRNKDEEFIKYWKHSGLVSDAFVRSYHTYNGVLESEESESKKIHNSCLVHWARFNIDVNGEVAVCFNEFFKDNKHPDSLLGNLNSTSIKEIWQSQKMNLIREASEKNDYSLFQNLPCKNCNSCQPLNSSRDTSEKQIHNLIRR